VRVLIVLRILWTAGAQRIAVNEYRWLRELGHEPRILFLRGHGTRGYEELLKGVDYRVLREGPGPLSPVLAAATKLFARDRGAESAVDLDLIAKVPEVAREERADYLVCHDQWAGLGCERARRELGIPYSVFIHERLSDYGVPVLGRVVSGWERRVLEGAARVLAVTEKVARSVEEKHGVRAEVNYPGMDPVGPDAPYSARRRVLLSVSFWDRGRRPEVYLDVARAMPEGYRLLMAGNWRIAGLKEEFLRRVRAEGLEDRVEVRDGIPEGELGSLYDSSLFLLRFGFGEYGLATSVIEAMQHALPVIINGELGTSRLIEECGCGLVTGGVDPGKVAEFLSRVDESEYSRMQRSIAGMRAKYTWRRHAEMLLPRTGAG